MWCRQISEWSEILQVPQEEGADPTIESIARYQPVVGISDL